jgi:hypothetical protein
VYAFGRHLAPLILEVKARKNGGGFVQFERWLGDYDSLALCRNNADPLILLTWRACLRRDQHEGMGQKKPRPITPVGVSTRGFTTDPGP